VTASAEKQARVPVPRVAGLFSGRLILCGAARCLWDDLKKAGGVDGADLMCINQAGLHMPYEFEHWVSVHGELFQWLVPLRNNGKGYIMHGKDNHRVEHRATLSGIMTHSVDQYPLVSHVWPISNVGTSSMFGARVGLALGYEQIILCGVPIDGTGHFFEAPFHKQLVDFKESALRFWQDALSEFKGKVFSMSGNTRELLGEP
jgi:hypothetical protein